MVTMNIFFTEYICSRVTQSRLVFLKYTPQKQMLTQKALPKWHWNLHIHTATETNRAGAEPFSSTMAHTEVTAIQSIGNEKESEATI